MPPAVVLGKFDMEPEYSDEDITEAALTYGIECCQHCGWWMESRELVPDTQTEGDSPALVGLCFDCRKAMK